MEKRLRGLLDQAASQHSRNQGRQIVRRWQAKAWTLLILCILACLLSIYYLWRPWRFLAMAGIAAVFAFGMYQMCIRDRHKTSTVQNVFRWQRRTGSPGSARLSGPPGSHRTGSQFPGPGGGSPPAPGLPGRSCAAGAESAAQSPPASWLPSSPPGGPGC